MENCQQAQDELVPKSIPCNSMCWGGETTRLRGIAHFLTDSVISAARGLDGNLAGTEDLPTWKTQKPKQQVHKGSSKVEPSWLCRVSFQMFPAKIKVPFTWIWCHSGQIILFIALLNFTFLDVPLKTLSHKTAGCSVFSIVPRRPYSAMWS